MIYIFEDSRKSDISKLFMESYREDSINKFIYVDGNENIVDTVERELKEVEGIVVYLDMIPGNISCYEIYQKLKTISECNNFKVVVLTIVCAEYYFIRSVYNEKVLNDNDDVRNCINKVPYIKNLFTDGDKNPLHRCKNFEKFCKAIIGSESFKGCTRPYNHTKRKFGQYYRKSCPCEKGEKFRCKEKSLEEKSFKLLCEYKYIPLNSCINSIHLSKPNTWEVHRKMVDEFNEFVDRYIELDKGNNFGDYRKIKYIKEGE